jgi:hypothetical protein
MQHGDYSAWRHYGWYASESVAKETAERQSRKFNVSNFGAVREWQWEFRVNPDTIPAA